MTDLISINNFRALVDKKKQEILQNATIEIPLSLADTLINSYVRTEILGQTKTEKRQYRKHAIDENNKAVPVDKNGDKPPAAVDAAVTPPKSELDQLAEKLKAAKAAGNQQQERPVWQDTLDKVRGNRPVRPEKSGSYV